MKNAIFAPLVVDLDGTLTPTDTLVESVICLVKHSPLNVLRLPVWLARGRAEFKNSIALHASISPALLPYRQDLLDYLKEEKAKGRQVVLATAAHQSIAQGVASHLDIFDKVLASGPGHNLKGQAKLEAIRHLVGEDFVYAGDSRADLPIWKSAQAAVLVGAAADVAAEVRRSVPVEREFSNEPAGAMVWVRALRIHQWLKNLLIFVPLLTAFSFLDLSKVATLTLAFIAFSLAASATYIGNDLWDLENDREHPRKRTRAFASARLSIVQGLAVAGVLLLLGLGLACAVSVDFLLMLCLYLVLTSAYTWMLKKYVLIDGVMLSLLYTLRVLAGTVAINIALSSWLLAFSVLTFLSQALVKRCSELVLLQQMGLDSTQGRDYRVTDLAVLWPMGVGAALSAVVVFGLFISAPETHERYASPRMLWLVAVGLLYWLARLWLKTSRGEMHDDPLIYALRDYGSRLVLLAMMAIAVLAHFFHFQVIP